MHAIRRYERIMEAILARKEVTVLELSELLQVSGKTIREDLGNLEEQKLLKRVHGGAILAQNDQLGILSMREANIKHKAEKMEIAARALQHIKPGDVIALDGGSTTLEIARGLDNQPLTVITNDLNVINELTTKDQIRLVVPGGYRVRNILTGDEAVTYVRRLNVQKAFVSATALHLEYGLSIYTGELLAFKQALVETAQTTYAVIDHYKFGQSALHTFATLTDIDIIITDEGLSAENAEAFKQAGTVIDYKRKGV
ncbi:MAG: DeoR/GlpR transcriptional regulator [Gorillibacterium sp.]|nr:DeoR/GlpR transcriptional regulator [Gorillibacterium sp.]